MDNETKQETLRLFKNGFPIEKISVARQLSRGTIESHLLFYIEHGKLKIEDVLDTEKITSIRQAIEKVGGDRLTPIKEFLGEGFSFNEIKMVMVDPEFTKQIQRTHEPIDASR